MPVVIAIFAILVVVVFVPPILILPVTVAVPEFIFQAIVQVLEVGWLIVTFPFTVKIPVEVWVSEVLLPPATNVKPVQVLVLLMV